MDEKEIIGVDPAVSKDYTVISTSSSSQLEPISIEKLREIMAQYAESHVAYMEERRNEEAAHLIERYKAGGMDRGTLAKRLVDLGYPQLVVVELLEKNSL